MQDMCFERYNVYACEFKNTFDDRILEHLIQTIESQHLIQKCKAKRWELSLFLLEEAQAEDISLQVHGVINTLDSRHIARVRIPKKQIAYMNYCSSNEEDGAMVGRHCSYDRKHN